MNNTVLDKQIAEIGPQAKAEQTLFALVERLEAAAIAADNAFTEHGFSDGGESQAKLSAERLALLECFREREATIEFERSLVRSLTKVGVRLEAQLTERDATIAELRDRIGERIGYEIESSAHVDALKAEIAQLRKALEGVPQDALDGGWNVQAYTAALKAELADRVFCEMDETHDMKPGMICVACWNKMAEERNQLRKRLPVGPNEVVEGIRHQEMHCSRADGTYLRLPRWVDIMAMLSAYDALAQDNARYANAHDVLVAELRGVRERLEDTRRASDRWAEQCFAVEERLQDAREAANRAEERERQLREVIANAIAEVFAHGAVNVDELTAALAHPQPQGDSHGTV